MWELAEAGGWEGGENQPTIPGILYVRLDLRRAHDINSLFEAGIGASIASLLVASRLALCSGSPSSPTRRFTPCQLVCHPLLVYISLFRVVPTASIVSAMLARFAGFDRFALVLLRSSFLREILCRFYESIFNFVISLRFVSVIINRYTFLLIQVQVSFTSLFPSLSGIVFQ